MHLLLASSILCIAAFKNQKRKFLDEKYLEIFFFIDTQGLKIIIHYRPWVYNNNMCV